MSTIFGNLHFKHENCGLFESYYNKNYLCRQKDVFISKNIEKKR